MIPLASAEYRYTYYFNAKSASSSYRSLFVDLHRQELPEPQRETLNIHNAFQHFNPVLRGTGCDRFSYTIVRHPYPRLVSAYLDKCVDINTPQAQRFQIQDHVQWIYRPIFAALGRDPDWEKGFSFLEFLHYLEQAFEQRRPLDIHFDSQWNSRTKIDTYYRIEDPVDSLLDIFRAGFGDAYESLALEDRVIDTASNKLNRSFSGEYQTQYQGAKLAGCDFAELNALIEQGQRFSYEDFMTDESMRLLSAIYAEEMKAYHYSPELDCPIAPE
ncbi:hypothetical protein A3709_11075 [Halioglobus sp. HI00S01]|uniref:sulfotransferase family 2 domain-containing protein n=1 Tax=Halioglobus sp. HI00S01 TaxID=1822214 RepID=UPI0007C355EA|nr:sulfotransferase family 2 domain-containing protein [Halioglobus sp. HI00S01]KZX51351.1 hypothetical protein A3709_11075 [Halioglobus sp. HI00S01]